MLAIMMWMCLAADAALQPAARGVAVAGVVQDQTGAVLPAARVALRPAGAPAPAQTIASDAAGRFVFDRVPPGSYDIRTEFAGFKTAMVRVRVGTRAPGPVTVVMELEGVTQDVSVTNGGAATSTTSAANLNAITVDQDALDNLPILDQDVVSALSRFLDSSAIGTGGTVLLVDGIEVSGLKLSASAIQQIKINQDPYAAEFMRPGRGRIEIVTKPGGRDYNGTFNLRFRDSALYARNAFATDIPPQQRRIFEGSFGGPVRGAEKTSFLLSGSHDAEDSQAVIFARTLDGTVQADAPTPASRLLFTAAWNHMQGDKHLQSVRLSHLKEKNPVQGIGGTSLPEVAINHEDREDELTFSQQSVLSPRLLNEFRLLVGDEFEPRVSLHPDRRTVVLDAFTGGGAQGDSLRTEHHFTLTETVTWSSGRQTVKFGLNIPDWSWRGFDDRSNTGGTFAFSSLQDFSDHRPYSFTQQAGDGHAAFLEKIVGGFVQDDIRLRPNLSVDVGLRYDWQSYFHDMNNFAPRASFAYAPDEARHIVIRGGAGVFYDRTGPGPILDLIRYDGQHLARYVIVDPGYPNPLGPGQTLGAQPASLVQLGPDVTIPYTVQYSIGVERQLRPKTTLSVNVVGSRGVDLFRSRDVNAPPPPDFAARPDPTRGVVRQMESAGRMETRSLQFTLRGQMTKYFNGSAEYSFGRALNDTSGINWMPPNAYDLSLEYARADFSQRHRVEAFGALTPGAGVTIGVSATVASGRPYSLTTGTDLFHTGTANARPPGVARNSLEGPGFADVDLRASRDFELPSASGRKHTLNLGVDVFNALNHVNYNYYVGNLSSPFFGQAISANPPRRVQFSLRVRY
jgi:outer membrane receptor protein involved in Fe transport